MKMPLINNGASRGRGLSDAGPRSVRLNDKLQGK